MDPLTAALNLAATALQVFLRIWDAIPADQKAQSAGDWAKMTHNLAQFMLDNQPKIEALK